MNTLEKIVDYKTQELAHRRRQIAQKEHQERLKDQAPALGFLSLFDNDSLNIIAEIKKASPSAGEIRADFNPIEIAKAYQENGARAISVLTDEHFFKGSLNYLEQVKQSSQIPVLRKDFTLSEYDIFEARAFGADAILLIVAILDDVQIKDYLQMAHELGMQVLVEVHDAIELKRTLKQKINILGINNRNLKTFNTDYNVTLELMKSHEITMPLISESGLKTHKTLVELKEAGCNGFLIGESLMRAEKPGLALKQLIKGSI